LAASGVTFASNQQFYSHTAAGWRGYVAGIISPPGNSAAAYQPRLARLAA